MSKSSLIGARVIGANLGIGIRIVKSRDNWALNCIDPFMETVTACESNVQPSRKTSVRHPSDLSGSENQSHGSRGDVGQPAKLPPNRLTLSRKAAEP